MAEAPLTYRVCRDEELTVCLACSAQADIVVLWPCAEYRHLDEALPLHLSKQNERN
ncbi:hypothetical protein [Nocardiopsis synnemataformans]|uniref:hypothetical protein n=1 Tax=Nocardiopsis synnemataformans TaxID=61305 RepID=UPI003EBB0A05